MSLGPQARGRQTLAIYAGAAVLAVSVLAASPGLASASTAASATSPGTHAPLVSNPASLVNPFIGTTGSEDTFPGADYPFGMVQWSPDTPSRPEGGGYEYNDSSITGFSLTHLSGPGCPAEGDVPVLPTTGSINQTATDSFSHANESAQAGFYKVQTSNGVTTQLTTTARTGIADFTFPSTTQANLVFKLSGSAETVDATSFTKVSSTEVTGSVSSGHFCGAGNTYTLYFDMQFSQPFTNNGTFSPNGLKPGAKHLSVTASGKATRPQGAGKGKPEKPNHPVYHGALPTGEKAVPALTGPNGAYLTFNTTSNTTVMAKVGVSYVSVANASANLAAEQSGFNFSGVESASQSAWNSLLGKINVSGGTSAQQAEFYTALYHSLLHPNINSDDNGQYMGVDGKVHTVDSGHSAEYTNYSGWDIYRSQAQLEALVDPTAASDTAQSMVDDYAQSGMFPKWMENNGESYVMVGDPADAILADYYAFGATNFSTASALTDMVNEATVANNVRPALNYLESIGYVPDNGSEGCCNFYGPTSTSLEYNTADFALSAFAGKIGNTSDQTTFQNRAQDWMNVFNPATGFMEGRAQNGSFESGFNAQSGSDSNFVEATPYIYTGMVPFNLAGLTSDMGGTAKMTSYLNTVLSSFTGANGFAWMGNEPSIELPWEYDYVGEPYKTQQVVREVQDQLWSDTPGGLGNGNDDLGAMSAWFVWSALGMFPETPGTSDLALGSPMFTSEAITLPSGSTFTVNGTGAADNAPYVQSATWNGATWNNAYAPTTALTSGGTLTFTLGTSANTSWASGASAAPPSYGGSSGGGGSGFNNTGIESDGSTGASFDSSGNAYSANALASAGASPGGTVTANGIKFTWPNVAAGTPDNWSASGQTVTMSGSGSLSFLGSSTNGPSSGTATVTYTDGSTQSVSLGFSDWTLNGGSATVEPGNTTALSTSYRDNSTGGKETVNTYVFATTPVTLTSGKTVKSVTLPSSVSAGQIHVFAIATSGSGGGGGGGFPSGFHQLEVNSSSLCVDVSGASTANNAIVIQWTCKTTGQSNQEWQFNAVSNGFGELQNQNSGLDLVVQGASTAAGAKVIQFTQNGTTNGLWKPIALANGSWQFQNDNSGLCLDIPGNSTSLNVQLDQAACISSAAGTNQAFAAK